MRSLALGRAACSRAALCGAAHAAGERARPRRARPARASRSPTSGPIVVYLDGGAATRARRRRAPAGGPPEERQLLAALPRGRRGPERRDAQRRRDLPQRLLVLDAERLRPRPLPGRRVAHRHLPPPGRGAHLLLDPRVDERHDLRRADARGSRWRTPTARFAHRRRPRRAATACAPGPRSSPTRETVGKGSAVDVRLGDGAGLGVSGSADALRRSSLEPPRPVARHQRSEGGGGHRVGEQVALELVAAPARRAARAGRSVSTPSATTHRPQRVAHRDDGGGERRLVRRARRCRG